MEAAANVRIIPAKQKIMGVPVQQKKVNVAAYCRVSTEAENVPKQMRGNSIFF